MKLILILLLLAPTAVFAAPQSSADKAKDFEEAAYNYMYFGDFKNAQKMFSEAIQLRPDDSQLKLSSAKVLIAAKDFDGVVSQLESTELTGDQNDEKSLYLGIAFLGKGDSDKAQKNLMAAQTNPKFQIQAANYLKQLSQGGKKLKLGFDFGLNYDSRIIDEELLSTTDGSGGRLFMRGDVSYLAKRFSNAQLSVGAEFITLYSFDDDVSLGDATVARIKAPYQRELSFFGKNHDFVFDTRVEQVWLDINNDGSKEDLLRSFVLNSIAMQKTDNPSQFGYRLELRYDDGIEDSLKEGVNEVTGLGFTLGGIWNQFKGSGDDLMWTASAYLKMNMAGGENMKYQRFGINYVYYLSKRGFQFGFTGALRYTMFPDYLVDRNDSYFSVGALARKKLSDWIKADWAQFFATEFNASYTLNESSFDPRDYNRIIISAMLKGQWKF